MNTSLTRAKQADRAYVVMSRYQFYFQVVYGTIWRVGSNVMMSNTLQQGSNHPDALGYKVVVLWSWIILLISWNRISLESQDVAHLFNGQQYSGAHFRGGYSYHG